MPQLGNVGAAGVDDRESIATIAQLLDYAIVASAELRLPFLVYLLRIARRELFEGGGLQCGGPPLLDGGHCRATQLRERREPAAACDSAATQSEV